VYFKFNNLVCCSLVVIITFDNFAVSRTTSVYQSKCVKFKVHTFFNSAMDLSKMMTNHKYRSWYVKIHAIISKHGFGYVMELI